MKTKRNKTKMILFVLALLLTVAFTAVTAQAATKKMKLSKTGVTITSGKTKTVIAKGSYKKIKAKAKKKGFVKITVKGKKIKIR